MVIEDYEFCCFKREVIVSLLDGVKMASSVTLVTGSHNVLVGTGLPSDRQLILSGSVTHYIIIITF